MWKSKCSLRFCAILGRIRGSNIRGVRISLLLCEIEWDELSREGHQYLAAMTNVEFSSRVWKCTQICKYSKSGRHIQSFEIKCLWRTTGLVKSYYNKSENQSINS